MQFTLQITCDNAAFAPVHDDASEAERYRCAMREIGRILRTKEWRALRPDERSGFLRDGHGDRCGQWSLNSDDESEAPGLDGAELAAILAGLRLIQDRGVPDEFEDIATEGGRYSLPSDEFIDGLCDKLNSDAEA